jgi:hypothetical protein
LRPKTGFARTTSMRSRPMTSTQNRFTHADWVPIGYAFRTYFLTSVPETIRSEFKSGHIRGGRRRADRVVSDRMNKQMPHEQQV